MSYSGESEEVTRLMPVLQEIGCTTVAITGKPKSTLARECQHHFFFPEFEEACYMHLAPTSSTTALLVLGDALALVTSRAKNYTKEDFGLHHPAGALGKKLLVKVRDVMHCGKDNAVIPEGSTLRPEYGNDCGPQEAAKRHRHRRGFAAYAGARRGRL